MPSIPANAGWVYDESDEEFEEVEQTAQCKEAVELEGLNGRISCSTAPIITATGTRPSLAIPRWAKMIWEEEQLKFDQPNERPRRLD